jgi:hypothetical protein
MYIRPPQSVGERQGNRDSYKGSHLCAFDNIGGSGIDCALGQHEHAHLRTSILFAFGAALERLAQVVNSFRSSCYQTIGGSCRHHMMVNGSGSRSSTGGWSLYLAYSIDTKIGNVEIGLP